MGLDDGSPDPMPSEWPDDWEPKVAELGEAIWRQTRGQSPGIFRKDYWQGRMLDWAMRDPSFKVDLFRFVDVFPSLKTREQVARHVNEYLLRPGRKLPRPLAVALKAAGTGVGSAVATSALRTQIGGLAERFIVGRTPEDALEPLRALHADGFGFTVDLLGETCVSEVEADAYARRYIAAVDVLADAARAWPRCDVLEKNHLGPIPRANLSVKASALYSQADPADFEGTVGALVERTLPIFVRAKARGVFVNVDLEHWQTHEVTYALFERLVLHPELRSYPHVGIVVQAYLKSAPDDVDRLAALARKRGAPVTVRLVKGAYWDYETAMAAQRGWASPVWENKAATDAAYELLCVLLLHRIEWLWPAFGSHNLRSLASALVAASELGVPDRAVEVQMLYGMAEPERRALQSLGRRVRLYAPVGDPIPGMSYLVRRLLENTSNEGFLRLSHRENVDLNLLMARPKPAQRPLAKGAAAGMEPGVEPGGIENCPPTDFADRAQREAFSRAVQAQRATLPRRVPVVVAGEERFGGATLERRCPSDLRIEVARVALATVADVEAAVHSAREAYPGWRETPIAARAACLENLAAILNERRNELAALMCFEVGKPWRDADADIAEAIDFCRYYARLAPSELGPKVMGTLPGEHNTLHYEGRGVVAVIAPWNFPIAILCGMSVAALVAGNTVVMKPAEQSSALAYSLFCAMGQARFPPGAIQLLPGVGEDIGPALVQHPDVATIAFTGSKAVGLSIMEQASRLVPGQRHLKNVICEMGGKNAIVVDDDADLDEAVAGVVHSAFGYAGQKCSACSRVIVLGGIYSSFIRRLCDATASLVLGEAHAAGTRLGPVVDEEARDRLTRIIESPPHGSRLLYVGSTREGGWYVPAAIFEVDSVEHPLMKEELFGPILTVYRVSDFEQALVAAVATEYALTASVYSRSPAHLEEARQRLRVGNLYLNRSTTGAIVYRQPFGGFGLSGRGAKAGGPGYLLQFAEARSTSENTMRHGFTPELS